jgi:threonine/homoserine/homoserine lactone efflux protein
LRPIGGAVEANADIVSTLIALDQAIALFVVAVVLIAVPGPSVLFVVSRGVALGRRAALATVVGNELGLLVQGTAVAVGLGVIVRTRSSPTPP